MRKLLHIGIGIGNTRARHTRIYEVTLRIDEIARCYLNSVGVDIGAFSYFEGVTLIQIDLL